jgi:hypothetical protein
VVLQRPGRDYGGVGRGRVVRVCRPALPIHISFGSGAPSYSSTGNPIHRSIDPDVSRHGSGLQKFHIYVVNRSIQSTDFGPCATVGDAEGRA